MKKASEKSHAPLRAALGAAVMFVVAAAAVWRVVAIDLADHLALDRPLDALRWDPRQTQALLSAAMLELTPDPRAAERLALRAVQSSPADGRTYGVLARALLAQGREPAAEQLFRIALRRAPRDAPTRAAFAELLLRRGRVDEAVGHLFALAWIRQEHQFKAYADLVRVAEAPQGPAAIARTLAQGAPRTREVFYSTAFNTAASPQVADRLFAALAAQGPVAELERRAYVSRLIHDRRWFDAWAAWIEGLVPQARAQVSNLYDGRFERVPGLMPFEWEARNVAGAAIDVVDEPAVPGKRALRVAFFDQRVPFQHVQQYLLLPPGSYRLRGMVRLENLAAARGVRWSVRCAGTNDAPVAESEHFVGSRPWSGFELQLAVPATGCDAQLLRLETAARVPVEQQISGSIWFADFSVDRDRSLTAVHRAGGGN